MPLINFVKPNRYQDSVTLMQAAARLREMPGIDDASLMMGTEPNLEMLRDAGLLSKEGESAGPNDLVVALSGSTEALNHVEQQLEDLLRSELPHAEMREREEPHTLSAGLSELPAANFVLISTPGIYAAAEARKALGMDLHVMIFSDNVSLEDEA